MGPLLSRGVYRAPYLVKGLPALVAVDRYGVARKHLAVPPGASWERCVAWMEQKLELWDPLPQLVLVNPAKAVPVGPSTREIPSRMYRDPHDARAYRRILAKNAANRMPGRGSTLG
jgi:hypothetical protein